MEQSVILYHGVVDNTCLQTRHNNSSFTSAEQLHDVIIDVSMSRDGAFSQRCAVVKGHLLLGETRHIPCVAGVKGRFVNITVPGPSETLSICEVQVYGTTGGTIIYCSLDL